MASPAGRQVDLSAELLGGAATKRGGERGFETPGSEWRGTARAQGGVRLHARLESTTAASRAQSSCPLPRALRIRRGARRALQAGGYPRAEVGSNGRQTPSRT